MVSSALLFSQADVELSWITIVLTPIWLLSVGVGLGLILLALIFGVMFVLSRLPGLSTLNEDRPLRNRIVLGVGTLLLVVWVPVYLFSAFGATGADTSSLGVSTMVLVILIIAVLSYLLPLALIALASRRMIAEVRETVSEGILFWTSVIFGSMALFAIIGFLLAAVDGFGVFLPVKEPVQIVKSMTRIWPVTGTRVRNLTVPQNTEEGAAIAIVFDGNELRSLLVRSDQRLEIFSEPFNGLVDPEAVINVPETDPEGEPTEWYNTSTLGDAIPEVPIEQLYIRNFGDAAANVELTTFTSPQYPAVYAAVLVAFLVVAIYLIYFVQRAVTPKIAAIALSTYKTEVAQPLFMLLVAIGAVFLAVSVFIPYNTFGEDIKMLKDSGLMTILVFSIFLAVWAASKSVAEEIEGRTALTVLSKPVGRREFIIGKVLGISWSIALLYLFLGLVFMVCIAYKPIFDGRETATIADVTWQVCFQEMLSIVPGLVLAFMEATVFVTISVAISTRLPILANLMICFTIYVLGHLTPLMVQSTAAIEAFEPVVFFGQFIATILPVLDHFNVQAAVAGNTDVPAMYLGWSFVYTLIYGSICILLALVMFEDRDLA